MFKPYTITERWPAKNPDIIQLYTIDTPNGLKVSAMLEECGLPYEKHTLSFSQQDQFTPEFLSLNPNNKIPAIIDPNGVDGQALGLWESGAILLYLAEKTGRFIPSDHHARYETIQWLMWQMGNVGPMFGQFGHFHNYGGAQIEDKYALERYTNESRRLLGVLNDRLKNHTFIMGGDYTIADMATWPWVRSLIVHYEAKQTLALNDFPFVNQWLSLCMERPASVAILNP